MHEELKKHNIFTEQQPSRKDHFNYLEWWIRREKQEENSLINTFFSGYRYDMLSCPICLQHLLLIPETFLDLSLSFPDNNTDSLSVADLLSLYFTPIEEQALYKHRCGRCESQTVLRQTHISDPMPPYLIIHLHRFEE